MNKKYLLLSFFLIALLAFLNVTKVNSKISLAPVDITGGNAGDPTLNRTCATSGCHGGTAQNASLSTLALLVGTSDTLNIPNPTFKYTPGTQYSLTFMITAFTGRYGFQIVALNGSNNQAGTMTVLNSATTKINNAISRQYMGHLSANSTKTWTFRWTAPAVGTGPVTFYYAYNTANNDGTSNGDVIYKGSSTIQESTGSGIQDISERISDLNIFPNPVSNELGISFNLLEASNVSSQLYSLDGREVNMLMNEKVSEGNFARSFNTNDLPSGIYLMKLNVGGASITKKIVKQ